MWSKREKETRFLYKDIPKFRRDKEGGSDDGCAFFINSRTTEEGASL